MIYSPFQHTTIKYICHTQRLINMVKTNSTNPLPEEPPRRRSNRTAGKSPASVDPPARKPAAARKANTARKDTSAIKDKATIPWILRCAQGSPSASVGNDFSIDSDTFIGERKGPPEAIVPLPVAIAGPPLATLWEWTPHSGVSGENNDPPEAIVPAQENAMPTKVARGVSGERNGPPEAIRNGPPEATVAALENTMPTMVAHELAAAIGVSGHFAATNDNDKEYNEMGEEEDKNGDEDYDMAREEGKYGEDDYDNEDYDSVLSEDDDRDGDFVPTRFSSDDDDDFAHLLNDDDIDEEDRRIEKMASKSRTPTGRRRGNLIPGGPVAPNYNLMSAEEADEARKEYQSLRKNFRDGIRRERLRAKKGSSFDEIDYSGDLTTTLRPMALV